MKALVKYAPGPGNVGLREVPEPEPGPGQVKVEVKATGICGSDLHILHSDIKLALQPPVVMGHEFAGVIAEVGQGVTKWKPGMRVTCETAMHICGECLSCRTGRYNICPEKQLLGYVYDGAFAPYTIVNQNLVHALPENIDFIAGAVTEPLACCVHAVLELGQIIPGDVVAIAGPGAIGILCMQVAKAAGGYAIVYGLSQDRERLAIAKSLGADATVEVDKEAPQEKVLATTSGEGTDVFLECSGAPAGARMGLGLVRRGGQYIQVGLFGRPFELDFEQIAYKEIRVTGSLGQKWTAWRRALTLLERGQVATRPLVTHILPLSQWEEGFKLFEDKTALKVVLTPED